MIVDPVIVVPPLPEVLRWTSGRTVGECMVRTPHRHNASTTIAEVAAFFRDDRVHAALIVDEAGHLLAVVERADLCRENVVGNLPAQLVGRFDGREVSPHDPLDHVAQLMILQRRRRLAVVEPSGQLVGLLCLKQSGVGFCSDRDVARRSGQGSRHETRV